MAEEPSPDDMPGSGEMIARLRRLGRVMAILALAFGGAFVVLPLPCAAPEPRTHRRMPTPGSP